MLFRLKHFFLFTFLVASLSSSLFAQSKRVLVVPYTRFQFVSEFSLEEIAMHNDVKSDEVFSVYQSELNTAFTGYENLTFIPISSEDYGEIKKFIRYNIDKFKGRKYNASNLSLLPDEAYKSLLEENNASYILFINWYKISKSVHTVYVGDRNKRTKYSTHLIDYDIYNREKVKISGKANYPLKCGDFPTQSVINHKSLNAKELTVCYKSLLDELAKELSNSTNK